MRITSFARRVLLVSSVLMAGMSVSAAGQAQKAARKEVKTANAMRMPKKATARCADSTWSKADTQRGACSSHGGVAQWFGKAPANMTARCVDGEYWTNEERRGACSQHGGVAFWVKEKKSKKG